MVKKSLVCILVLAFLTGCAVKTDMRASTPVSQVNDISADSVQTNSHNSSAAPQVQADWELNAFTTVDISVDMSDVSFRPAEGYGIELLWYDERLKPAYRVENGTLTVTSPKHDNLYFDKVVSGGQINIYLPEEALLEKVSIKTGMGNIQIADKEISSLTADCNAGDIILNHISVQTMELSNALGTVSIYDSAATDTVTVNCNAGDMALNRVTAEAMELSNAMGAVIINGGTGVKTTDVQCDMGEIKVTGNIQGGVNLTNHMGDIRINTTTAAASIHYDLNTDMGTLTIDGRECKEHFTQKGEPYSLLARAKMGNIEVRYLEADQKENNNVDTVDGRYRNYAPYGIAYVPREQIMYFNGRPVQGFVKKIASNGSYQDWYYNQKVDSGIFLRGRYEKGILVGVEPMPEQQIKEIFDSKHL